MRTVSSFPGRGDRIKSSDLIAREARVNRRAASLNVTYGQLRRSAQLACKLADEIVRKNQITTEQIVGFKAILQVLNDLGVGPVKSR